MAQFKSFVPGVEVNGETVLSIVDGMGAFKSMAIKILSENGITDPEPGAFYSQQSWLNAFKQISDKLGPNTLLSIGRKIPENAQFPPEINTIEKALGAIDVAYHMNHRGGEIGHYKIEKMGEKSAKMICNNPYPCDFDRGIIDAMAKKFKTPSSIVVIQHDDSQPCRKNGSDSCTYIVKW